MTPTQWAQLVAQDLGINVSQDPNAVLDILAWMPHEEPTSSWWGGYGTATNPTRINPLNAGDIGKYGYAATPLTGNTLAGGLGTYGSLSDAAAASADMLRQHNMAAALAGLQRGDAPAQFTKDINATAWAQTKYAPLSALQAEAEAQGPTVKSTKVGSVSPTSSAVTQALASQTNPAIIANTAAENALAEQLNLSPAEYAFQRKILADNFGYTEQQFGIQRQQQALQMTGLQEQYNRAAAQYGFQREQDVLTGQSITDAINNIIQQYGFQQQALAQQTKQGLQSEAASGVYNTGTRREFLAGQQLTAAEEKATEQYQLGQERLAQRSLGVTEREQTSQYRYTQEQIQNGMKNLQLEQKKLGISEAQARTQYQNAINQLGLNNLLNVDQLEQQIFALVGGSYSPLSSIETQLQGLIPGLAGAQSLTAGG